MRKVLRWLLVVPVVLALACAIPSGARGDEAPKDDSAASKAFRDAWWAETGGGNLTQALDLYAKAADAEGPAAVRARALYRRAVVLQRIGKTEDALRALERLAKDFAGEAELLTQARARLAEWTAVDLRSSFGDWFKRYQYSPEFQAKIVDLVLKLGSLGDAGNAAARELLSIGEASVPALREGLKNHALSERSLSILLALGVVPDEITELLGDWTVDANSWSPVMAVPAERRAQLAARVKSGTSRSNALKAALEGPDAVLAWLSSPSQPYDDGLRHAVLWAFTRSPAGPASKERLAALVTAPEVSAEFRGQVASTLVSREWATPDHLRKWAASPDRQVRMHVWDVISSGKVLAPAEGWVIVRDTIGLSPHNKWKDEVVLPDAFLKALEGAPWPGDLDRAADMVVATGGHVGVSGQGRYLEVLARAFERGPDDKAASASLEAWNTAIPVPEGAEQVSRWALSAPTAARRVRAFEKLAQRATPAQTQDMLAVLVAPQVAPVERLAFWRAFFGWQQKAALVMSDRESVRELLESILALPLESARNERSGMASQMISHFRNSGTQPDALMEVLLAAPERAPFELQYYQPGLRDALTAAAQFSRWRAAWREAWNRWTPEQRLAGLALLDLLRDPKDAQMTEFLRQQPRARPAAVPRQARWGVLSFLETVELADIQGVYDLTKSDDLREVVKLILPEGNRSARMKPTLEVFEAMRAGLKSEMYDGIVTGMAAAFRHIPSVQRELAAALLARPEETVAGHAFDILLDRSSPEDEDLWIKALGNADKDVRARAAAGMERVPTENVKRALVKALDDPHPDVRAAVLTALDAIQKQEDLKARWRERVK